MTQKPDTLVHPHTIKNKYLKGYPVLNGENNVKIDRNKSGYL